MLTDERLTYQRRGPGPIEFIARTLMLLAILTVLLVATIVAVKYGGTLIRFIWDLV